MTNITMSIDEQILKEARKIAVEKNTSVNALVRQYLKQLVQNENLEKRALVERLKASFTKSQVEIGDCHWNRDDLYDR